ncbi:MAG: GNAT family N-acetyltransferase [Lachnospiraceae bacterium]|nr:GNAT family N-acetyltransferase [Lachnospiraceae bacterium]
MRFEEREIQLRDGRKCILRPTTPDYAQKMLEYLHVTAAETPFLLREPDEITYTLEDETHILQEILEKDDTVMMMALVDDEIAGNCSISRIDQKRRIRHRCSLAIALKQDYWNLGIGSAMMGYLTELAMQIGFDQMELGVIEGNDRARALYDKNGFVETGKIVNAMKYPDGRYRDEIIMSKWIGKPEE